MSEQSHVVVVGAGPVGLVTAILLGRAGWRVTVVERWPTRYPMPRACTIDHEALRILQSAGVMTEHRALFEPSRGERGGYEMRNGAGVLLQAINWNRTAESGWANTNGFYQPDLEAVLESMAQSSSAVSLRRGWSVDAVTQDADGVTVTVAATADRSHQEELRADWLVVDYEPVVDRQWDAFVTQYCDPLQPATAVKSGPGRRRFEFMRRADTTVEELGRPETAWRLIQPWGVTPDNARLERHAVYTFRGRWAEEWRRGRVFLAGDAAHLMPPFLGQGLCSGLRDASALAWRLAMVASGLAGDPVLDTYGPERMAHVREIIDGAVSIGQVVCELDPERAAERDARMTAALRDPEAVFVEPPHPRLGKPSINDPDDDLAGTLSLQARVQVDGVVGLFDDLVGGGWQLVALDVDPLGHVSTELRDWFAGIGGTVTTVSDEGPVRDVDGGYRAWFGAHGRTVVLARPDFYLFGTGDEHDVPRLLQLLHDGLDAENPHLEGALS